ncbi:dihydroneopterin aldolase [Pseudidiomarina planktonica]|uniref:7,8-dihydroneopterin aldolase n=1 Tax=Pseudidiomarina planktonica TaxID=1323738 RepID=A0A1Y6FZ41_9GAMM|nr:dihydroneopterin aldolase [Pseudidiomarina planktonica]RUO62909.1 dihydroneopterin aldolase [Pseudidiomarina planktonica]SMQ80799.1 dihydroneopterin aldolase [Pseudidiomarina planktonica]
MKDQVLIDGLKVDTVIGVYDWEKQIKQQLSIDLAMAWDNRPAAASDDLADALDYASVAEAVTNLIQQRPRQLIEQVAEEVAQLLLTEFKVTEVTVTVAKPGAVPAANSVAVKITRSAIAAKE